VSVSQPTLVSGATTITLPFPARSTQTRISWETVGGSRMTINGSIRTWSVGYRYRYALAFEYADISLWNSLVDLYWNNVSNQTSATFTWTGGPWTDAQPGVTVRIDEIGDPSNTYPTVDKADFTIVLVEVDARTS
jgi:hypothetical protein